MADNILVKRKHFTNPVHMPLSIVAFFLSLFFSRTFLILFCIVKIKISFTFHK